MWIGELARRGSVNPKTIRYYEDIGLLDPPTRTAGGFRDYGEDAADRLVFIRAAQTAGLRLGEVRATLALRDHGIPPCRDVLAHLAELVDALPRTIGELERFHADLQQLLAHLSDPSA